MSAADTTEMKTSLVSVRFNGENYRAWAYVCGLALEEAGIGYTIEAEMEQSGMTQMDHDQQRSSAEKQSQASSLPVSSSTGKEKSKKDAATIKKDQAKAVRIIATSVSESILEMIIGEKDPLVVWTMLRSQYESTSMQMQLHLQMKLNQLKMKDGEDFNVFWGKVRQMREQLRGTGTVTTDAQMISYILKALPKGYDAVKDFIVNTGTLKLEEVVAKLAAKSETTRLEQIKNGGVEQDGSEEQEDDGGELAAYSNGNYSRLGAGRGGVGGFRGGYGRGGVHGDSFTGGRGGSIQHGESDRGEFNSGSSRGDRTNMHSGRDGNGRGRCFNCGQQGHRAYECDQMSRRCKWCEHPFPNHREEQCYWKPEEEEEEERQTGSILSY
jgi:hypothetical protein